jgi:hypothetical protein
VRIAPERLAPALYWTFRGWESTLRRSEVNLDAVQRIWDTGGRVVFACWHNELFACTTCRRDKRLVTIVSASSDGALLAGVLSRLGFWCARGSSSKLGVRALIQTVKVMRDQQRDGVITVDGPRGPRHQVKDGVIYLAHRLGAYLVPTRGLASRKFIFSKAWDRFELPLPLARVQVVYGEPYKVEAADLDQAAVNQETARLAEKLHALG